MTDDLADCGRQDTAAAYRRLADDALAAAAQISDPHSTPGAEEHAYRAVTDALLRVDDRRCLLAAARRGAQRARSAA